MSACEACQAIQTSRAAQGETPRRSQNRTNWTGSFVISQAVRPIRPGSRSFQRPNLDHLLRPRQLSLRGLSRERAWHHDVGGSAVFPTAMRGYTWITSSSTRAAAGAAGQPDQGRGPGCGRRVLRAVGRPRWEARALDWPDPTIPVLGHAVTSPMASCTRNSPAAGRARCGHLDRQSIRTTRPCRPATARHARRSQEPDQADSPKV